MISQAYRNMSGLMLCLSGALYILDTALDAFAPNLSPGLGAFVPIFGLVGLPGFLLSLQRGDPDRLSLAAYGLGMVGLCGLVSVTFLGNRLFPDLTMDEIVEVLTALRPEFLIIGLTFLSSALAMLFVSWRKGQRNRSGGVLYALGAIPVSLTPLMPEALVTLGGLSIGTGLLIWGWGLFAHQEPSAPASAASV